MDNIAGLFGSNFDENTGALGAQVSASTFAIPLRVAQYIHICLPADEAISVRHRDLVPSLGSFVDPILLNLLTL